MNLKNIVVISRVGLLTHQKIIFTRANSANAHCLSIYLNSIQLMVRLSDGRTISVAITIFAFIAGLTAPSDITRIRFKTPNALYQQITNHS